MQDVISPRKMNMCRRSPELGRSTFERKILVKFMVQCKRKGEWGIRRNQKLLNLPFNGLYWKDSNSKLWMGGERTKTGVRVKYPGGSWKEEGKWGNLNFCGWVVWWSI